MNCNDITEQIVALAADTLSVDRRDACMAHIAECDDCADALRGAESLRYLRRDETRTAPEGLFDRIVSEVASPGHRHVAGRPFWLGAAFGGAVAASLLAIVMMLRVVVWPVDIAPQVAEFYVSADGPRLIHIAIETDRELPGAEISILLSGAVEIDGTGGRRELSWTDDLDAGVNKLSLPLLASGDGGGQMVVRLSHPDSEQLFVIDLPFGS